MLMTGWVCRGAPQRLLCGTKQTSGRKKLNISYWGIGYFASSQLKSAPAVPLIRSNRVKKETAADILFWPSVARMSHRPGKRGIFRSQVFLSGRRGGSVHKERLLRARPLHQHARSLQVQRDH